MAAFFQRNWWPRTDHPARIRFLLAPPWPIRIRIKAYLAMRPVVVSRRPLPKYNHHPIGPIARCKLLHDFYSLFFFFEFKSSWKNWFVRFAFVNPFGNRGWVFGWFDLLRDNARSHLQFSLVDLHLAIAQGDFKDLAFTISWGGSKQRL